MAWTTAQDVLSRWVGPDRPTDTAAIDTQIGDAERYIALRHPQVIERLDNDELDLETLKMVVARMVLRVVRNPSHIRQATDTTGPFAKSVTYAGDRPGELYLTDDDLADLGETTERRSGRAFTINTAVGSA